MSLCQIGSYGSQAAYPGSPAYRWALSPQPHFQPPQANFPLGGDCGRIPKRSHVLPRRTWPASFWQEG
ncbi:MAG: hypothetical protein R3D55_11955 [Chloroflexota bacterium]